MSKTIKLATWGKLPTYWPLYIALNKAAKKCDLLIEVELIKNDKVPPENADLILWGGSAPHHGRLIPCMWRQPSWLLAKNESNIEWPPKEGRATNHKVFLLPPGTTNGDYGRLIGHKKRWWRPNITFNNYDLSEIHDCINNELSTSNMLLSFLPLHNLLDNAWPKLKLIDEFLGPNDCVTSFQILRNNPFPRDFEKKLTAELRIEFDRLFFSEEMLGREIDKASPYKSLNRFTNINDISNTEPFFQLVSQAESIEECVRSYLKYGCYFPYRPFGRIAQTINDVVKEKYQEAIKEGYGKSAAQLNEMYGANCNWSDLSYRERKSAFSKDWYYIDSDGQHIYPDEDLPNFFFHLKDNNELEPLRIFVYPTKASSPTPLSNYSVGDASEVRDSVCSSDSDNNTDRCHKNCFMCLITGSVSSIIYNARKSLSITKRVPDSILDFTQKNGITVDSKFYNASYIVWADVKDFFDVFAHETSARPTQDPNKILISILEESTENKTERLLLCVSYYGDIKPGQSNGNGTATKTLENLVSKLKRLGYHESKKTIWKTGDAEPQCHLWESIKNRTYELELCEPNIAYLLWIQVT